LSALGETAGPQPDLTGDRPATTDSGAPAPSPEGGLITRLRQYVTGSWPPAVYLPYALLWTVGGTALFTLVDPRVDGWVPDLGAVVTGFTMVVVLLLQRAVDDLRDLDYDRAYNPHRPLARGAVRPSDLAVLLAVGTGLVLLVNAWRWPAMLVLAGLLAYTFLLLWADRKLGWPPGDALGLGMLAGAPVQILVNLYLYAALLHAAGLAPSWHATSALAVALAAFAHLELARKLTRQPKAGERTYVHRLGVTATAVLAVAVAVVSVAVLLVAARPGVGGGWVWLCAAPLALVAWGAAGFWGGRRTRWPLGPAGLFLLGSFAGYQLAALLAAVTS